MSSYPIPFSQFTRLLSYFPRAHPVRVGCLLLAFTGARPSELDKMKLEGEGASLLEGFLYWPMGKTQKGWRKEPLPQWFIEEIKEYRAAYPAPTRRILHYNSVSLRRDLWKHRANIGGRWTEYSDQKKPVNNRKEFILQLKGFRKSFSCTVFAGYWGEFGDVTAAMEFACSRMGHSNRGITVTNYLTHYKAAEVEAWRRWLAGEKAVSEQARILDYLPVQPQIYKNMLKPCQAGGLYG